MKILFALLSLVLLMSCKNDVKKTCDFYTTDQELVIYNSVLTELVVNKMGKQYLGGKENEIYDKYYFGVDKTDTAKFENEIIKAHNDLFNNPSKFCTLYLDTVTSKVFYYDSEGVISDPKFKALINQYTLNERAAVDSLNGVQRRFSSNDFGLCVAKIDKLENWSKDTTECFIGTLRLSKLVLSKEKDKGLVFYDWHCGLSLVGLCGHRGIIAFEKISGKWEVESTDYLSVY